MRKSLTVFIGAKRDDFDDYESKLKAKSDVKVYHDTQRCQIKRRFILAFADSGCSNEELLGREKFRVETFLPPVDTLVSILELRNNAYVDIVDMFVFLESMHELEKSEFQNIAKSLQIFIGKAIFIAKILQELVSADLISECHHLAAYLKGKI
ncbi:hypothetical protein R5R35_012003 [Gryllus longicercus]|uniref:Uncharacterized protein n=1 Tax=Gryllus longicercus TaxID=2509291 RepID=A0AAN9W0U1_9ORTH